MQYMLMLYSEEAGWGKMKPEEQQKWMAAYCEYYKELSKAGIFKGTGRLQSSATATTIRVQNGNTEVQDGPYAESKEQMGGYFIIDVPDLDAAIEWAKKCPAAGHGTVEVRPMRPTP